MPWTTEQKLESLLRLPWTVIQEPADDVEAPEDIVVRVAELQGMIVIGTPAEINAEFWPALRATLAAYLENDDYIALPPGVETYPWEAPAWPQATLRLIVSPLGEAWQGREQTGAAAPVNQFVAA